jgi:hypothetical protein
MNTLFPLQIFIISAHKGSTVLSFEAYYEITGISDKSKINHEVLMETQAN